VDISQGREYTTIRNLLGAVMAGKKSLDTEQPSVLDVVALLTDIREAGLARGQVGTVVELLDEKSALVEFADDHGRAYAISPCLQSNLLVLHYMPEVV
jgi:hypothetical protein